MFYNRFSKNRIAPPRWNMGFAGYFVNFFALTFLSLGIVMICFPAAPKPNAKSFNWTVVIFSGVVLFSVGYYYARGRKKYISPRSRIGTGAGGTGIELENRLPRDPQGTLEEGAYNKAFPD